MFSFSARRQERAGHPVPVGPPGPAVRLEQAEPSVPAGRPAALRALAEPPI
jgi:hypothetical protein